MKLTPEYIKKLIKEELDNLFEQEKKYYLFIPNDGNAVLQDENGKQVTDLFGSMDFVRDPVKNFGTQRDVYLNAEGLNQYFIETAPKEFNEDYPTIRKAKGMPEPRYPFKSKPWWENMYAFFKDSNLSTEEKQNFKGHPSILPGVIKSIAGVMSQFKRIPVESIQFAAPAGGNLGYDDHKISFRPKKPVDPIAGFNIEPKTNIPTFGQPQGGASSDMATVPGIKASGQSNKLPTGIRI